MVKYDQKVLSAKNANKNPMHTANDGTCKRKERKERI
jgi:hypothetical protein